MFAFGFDCATALVEIDPENFEKKIPRAKAQQKWSQAGTEVLEELELRVMYPDTDLSVPKQRIPHLRSSRAGNV